VHLWLIGCGRRVRLLHGHGHLHLHRHHVGTVRLLLIHDDRRRYPVALVCLDAGADEEGELDDTGFVWLDACYLRGRENREDLQ
jgi:hypothetical protein